MAGARVRRGHPESHPILRGAVSRLVMPSRRGCDCAATTGSGTAFQPVIGAPRESPAASRRDGDVELASRRVRLRAR
jgi:hypothetical protein